MDRSQVSTSSTIDALQSNPVKDNRSKAIIFINFFALGTVGNSIFFKFAAAEGT
jgi:hypothetical protein